MSIPDVAVQNFSVKSCPENFTKLTGKYLCWNLFFNKVTMSKRACNLIKRDSDKDLFLWSLRNFLEKLFYRAPVDGCFWTSPTLNKTQVINWKACSFNFSCLKKKFLHCTQFRSVPCCIVPLIITDIQKSKWKLMKTKKKRKKEKKFDISISKPLLLKRGTRSNEKWPEATRSN